MGCTSGDLQMTDLKKWRARLVWMAVFHSSIVKSQNSPYLKFVDLKNNLASKYYVKKSCFKIPSYYISSSIHRFVVKLLVLMSYFNEFRVALDMVVNLVWLIQRHFRCLESKRKLESNRTSWLQEHYLQKKHENY